MLIYSFFPILRLPLFIPRTRPPSSSSAGRDDEHSHSLLPFQAPRRSSSFPRHGRSSPSLPSSRALGRRGVASSSPSAAPRPAVRTAPSGGGRPAWLPGATLGRVGTGTAAASRRHLRSEQGTRVLGREEAGRLPGLWLRGTTL